MLADPQSITYATVAKSLPAISRGEDSSVYRLDDGTAVYELRIQHNFAKRNRAIARLTRTSLVTDPLISSNSVQVSMSATVTLDFPVLGLSVTDAQSLGKALVAFLSDATLLKLANGET